MTVQELKDYVIGLDLLRSYKTTGLTLIDSIPYNTGFAVSCDKWSLWYGEEDKEFYLSVYIPGVEGYYKITKELK